MNFEALVQQDMKKPVAITLGLILAMVFAVYAGMGDFQVVKMLSILTMLCIYLVFLHRFTWHFAFIFCVLDMWWVGLGFKTSSFEQTTLIGALLFVATFWRKGSLERPSACKHISFSFFNAFLLIWLLYVGGHTLYNHFNPYSPRDYSLKSSIKIVAYWTGPAVVMWYFINRPTGLSVRRNMPHVLGWLLTFGLASNLFMRFYEFATGLSSRADTLMEAELPYFQVPILKLIANVYTLRGLPQVAVLFGLVFYYSAWAKRQTKGTIWMLRFLIVGSLIGSVISGGRAASATVVFFIVVALYVKRRFGPLWIGAACGLLMVAVINVVPSVLKEAPYYVARSLQWALINKDEYTSNMIKGSSQTRIQLAEMGLIEWQKDQRVIIFGRGTYSFTIDDVKAWVADQNASIDIAVRRGSTHNMITDLLLIFGAVGLFIYLALVASYIAFLWHIYNSKQSDENAKNVAFVLFVSTAQFFAQALLGGGMITPTMGWLTVILVAYLYREANIKETGPQNTTLTLEKIRPVLAKPLAPKSWGLQTGAPELPPHTAPLTPRSSRE